MSKNHGSRRTSDCGFHDFTFSTNLCPSECIIKLWVILHCDATNQCPTKSCSNTPAKFWLSTYIGPPTKQNDSTVDINDERCVNNATFSYIKLASFIWLNFYQQWSALHTVYSLLWNKHSTRLVGCMSYPVVLISFRNIFFPSFSLIHAKHKKWEKENSDNIHNHGNKRSQKQKTFRPVSNSGCTGVLIHLGGVGYIH